MLELSLEYWNTLSHQMILTSSLMSGFSMAIVVSLLVYESDNRFINYILKASTICAGCFLITIFAATKIFLMTTKGYPFNVEANDITFPRIIGGMTYMLGIICLSVVIMLSGWTKSRSLGIFTTIVGVLTFLLILMTSVDIKL